MAAFTTPEIDRILSELFLQSDPVQSELSPSQKGAYRIPQPSGFRVLAIESLISGKRVTVGWIDVEESIAIKGYRIYAVDTSASVVPLEPVLVGGVTRSPAQVVIDTPASSTVVLKLQPFLASGLELSLDACPSCTIVS